MNPFFKIWKKYKDEKLFYVVFTLVIILVIACVIFALLSKWGFI